MRQNFPKQIDLYIDETNYEHILDVPEKVRIRTRYLEDEIFVDTRGTLWRHERYCNIDWKKSSLRNPVLASFKKFIWFRLSSVAPRTADSNFKSILNLEPIINTLEFPWSLSDCESILALSINTRLTFLTFRLFYRWAVSSSISGFSSEIASSLDDIATPDYEVYRSVKLRKSILTPTEEALLLESFSKPYSKNDYFDFQDKVITHLSWELGCRSEQISGIEHGHFIEIKGTDKPVFYHLKLIRMKQRSYKTSYRNRVISEKLALKIKSLINLKERILGPAKLNDALFINRNYKRTKNGTISMAITSTFDQADLKNGSNTLLRHNMAQKLADQGTPGDLISDMLDHTTKIAARYYVAATPEIGHIKSRALGKNATYLELMSLMTGKPIKADQITNKSQIIKGVVSSQYIGNIGICGLDIDTPCAKNPIYSCYTCRKFNPFIDGNHDLVVKALRTEVKILMDHSTNLTENKVVLQLEKTIEHTEFVRKICSGDDNI